MGAVLERSFICFWCAGHVVGEKCCFGVRWRDEIVLPLCRNCGTQTIPTIDMVREKALEDPLLVHIALANFQSTLNGATLFEEKPF